MSVLPSETELPVRLRRGRGGKTVIAFPFAGGSALSMRRLSMIVPEDAALYAVRPPGHGGDIRNPLETIDEMAELYLSSCLPIIGPDTVFFGHSMGALAAYKCLELQERRSGTTIAGFIVSGMNPPVPELDPFRAVGDWNDEYLIEYLCGLGGFPEDPQVRNEMIKAFLPVIKIDLHACMSMVPPSGRLRVSAMVLAGRNDRCVVSGALVEWQRFFEKPVVFHEDCGEGHFFYENEPHVVRTLVADFLSADRAARS